jgi:hypothetical protein
VKTRLQTDAFPNSSTCAATPRRRNPHSHHHPPHTVTVEESAEVESVFWAGVAETVRVGTLGWHCGLALWVGTFHNVILRYFAVKHQLMTPSWSIRVPNLTPGSDNRRTLVDGRPHERPARAVRVRRVGVGDHVAADADRPRGAVLAAVDRALAHGGGGKGGLRVALKDARWSALYREPMPCNVAASSSNRCRCLWCRPSPALAAAEQEEVNELWAGLGYYRRAKFLLEGARHVCQNKGGAMPNNSKELGDVPGVGPYTAAAVASIAFNEPIAAVDGNVIRVASRLACIRGGGGGAR